MMETEKVTVSAGVPTVWLGLVQYLEQHDLRVSTLQRIVSGRSAIPPPLVAKFAENYGVEVRHGWGMTETVAVATLNVLDSQQMQLPPARKQDMQSSPSKANRSSGWKSRWSMNAARLCRATAIRKASLLVRGQWTVSGYYK